MSSKFAKSLECPICFELPRKGPIPQCDNGHLLCSSCRKKITLCPVCKSQLRGVRSLLAEEVLETIPMHCSFKQFGCEENLPAEKRSQHESECSYRLVICPCQSCSVKVSLVQLSDHTAKDHKIKPGFHSCKIQVKETHFGEVTSSSPGEWFWLPHEHEFKGRKFYNISMQNYSAGLWYFWVYLAGTQDEAKDYKFSFSFENSDGGEYLNFGGVVNSIDMPRADVIKNGSYCVFPNSLAKKFLKNGNLEFEIEVFQDDVDDDETGDLDDDDEVEDDSRVQSGGEEVDDEDESSN